MRQNAAFSFATQHLMSRLPSLCLLYNIHKEGKKILCGIIIKVVICFYIVYLIQAERELDDGLTL